MTDIQPAVEDQDSTIQETFEVCFSAAKSAFKT